MLRKIAITLASLLVLLSQSFAQDTSKHVYTGIGDYLESIVLDPVDSIIKKCTLLIDQAKDNEYQSKIAGIIFNYFSQSPVMGVEAVAVYMADSCFLNKKLEWPDKESYPLLYTYAEFNRESLIGKEAPDLIMENIYGDSLSMRSILSDYKILYFYDDQCATCNRETPQLVTLLNNCKENETISLFAIYTSDDKEKWKAYVKEHFSQIKNDNITVYNLWDPEALTSYHKKYSVLSTPQLLLLDANNVIRGRKLDCTALSDLLSYQDQSYNHSIAFFDSILGAIDHPIEEDIARITDYIYEKSRDDRTFFTDTFYALFNYLRSSQDYEFQKGAVYLAQIYIIEKPEFWSKEMIDSAGLTVEMFNLNPLGSKATDVVLLNKRGREKNMLQNKQGYTLLFFNLVTCKECASFEKELNGLTQKLKDKKVKVTSIYVADDVEEWKKHIKNGNKKWVYLRDGGSVSSLHDKYDLMIVPKVYLLDREKTVIAKDINIHTLDNLLDSL